MPRADSGGWVSTSCLHSHWCGKLRNHVCGSGTSAATADPEKTPLKAFCPESPSSWGQESCLRGYPGGTLFLSISTWNVLFVPFSGLTILLDATGHIQSLCITQGLRMWSLCPSLSLTDGSAHASLQQNQTELCSFLKSYISSHLCPRHFYRKCINFVYLESN